MPYQANYLIMLILLHKKNRNILDHESLKLPRAENCFILAAFVSIKIPYLAVGIAQV